MQIYLFLKRAIVQVLATIILFSIYNIALANIFSSEEQIFKLSATTIPNQAVRLHWSIAENAYLYQKFIKITPANANEVQVGHVIYPEGQLKKTALFGPVTVYHTSLDLNVPIENLSNQPSVTLDVYYQGCSEKGQCFPPITQTVKIDFPPKNMSFITTQNESALPEQSSEKREASNSITQNSDVQAITNKLFHHSIWSVIGLFLALGLFLAVTPCILPMIPILSSIILHGYDKNSTAKSRAFSLSLAYVVGVSMAYGTLGLLMSIVGLGVQGIFQNPYIIIIFGFVFILLGFSLFGFFELKLSGNTTTKLNNKMQKLASIASKNHFTVGIIGFLSALVVSPCVTPPLVGALAYITATGDILRGFLALFFMGLGMGIPLILIAVLGHKIIPKAGTWTEFVKIIFGFMLIGVALFLWQRVLPLNFQPLVWGLFIIVMTIFCFYRIYRIHIKPALLRMSFYILCILALILGAIPVVEYVTGYHIISTSITEYQKQKNLYIRVTNTQQLNKALVEAQLKKIPVMIDFYADWCSDCHAMEKNVFSQNDIQNQLQKFIWIKVDMTQDTQDIWDIQEIYNIAGPPTFLFYSNDGKPLKTYNFVGLKSHDEVLEILQGVSTYSDEKK